MTDVQREGTKVVFPQVPLFGKQVVIGERYHVVIRSTEFGNDEYEGTLESIQTLDGSAGPFNILWFKNLDKRPLSTQAAREFTIQSINKVHA